MRTRGMHGIHFRLLALGWALAWAVAGTPLRAEDARPTGAPLVLSSIETEQGIPLAILLPDGKTAKCVTLRLHWSPNSALGPDDDATSFTLDLPSDNPAASIFTAQLWSASLASALAWQEPWQGARWKVLQTPVTDGTGLGAGLAVGMIATSARRPYPPKTVVIGSLNPDGSLGPVSHLPERMQAAAEAGMTRVIIPDVQRFDTDSSGQVLNMVRQAGELHLECIPVDTLVAATETAMNDPLPDSTLSSSTPKYSNDVATYIDDFAHREQDEAASGLKFAPKETDLAKYPPHLAAIWKSVYADFDAGQQAYRGGQVYVAYQLFSRANGCMNGANALAGQTRASFDVKSVLADSDDLRDHLHTLMNPPEIDKGGLESAVLVAEMADWAYDIDASLEGAQLVTKQTFSQRSDATDAEKDRARESILFAIEQSKYLLNQANFYNGLLAHISDNNPVNVDENAAHLLPQLIPAQLATARRFTDGIRERASDLRDGLLFDPRLVAYVNVLREAKNDWDSRQRKKEMDAASAAGSAPVLPTPAPGPDAGTAPSTATPAKAPPAAVGFDPGNTYAPPHTLLVSATAAKKLSDAAQCLIWVNNDCEIATLDEKYLRLSGTIDPATREWHVKDRAKLDALLQTAELGARHGIAFAEKAEIDSSVLSMIYEKASHLSIQGDDLSALDALRNYWRCALLGNMCWQLAHTHKAQPVDVSNQPPTSGDKTAKTAETPTPPAAAVTNAAVVVVAPSAPASTPPLVTPVPPASQTNATVVVAPPSVTPAPPVAVQPPPVVMPTPAPTPPTAEVINPPVAPIATNDLASPASPSPAMGPALAVDPPVAPIATNDIVNPAPPAGPVVNPAMAINPPVAPIATNDVVNPVPPVPTPDVAADTNLMNIPVAPIAKVQDFTGGETAPETNAAPIIGPIPPPTKPDNADGHAAAFP